jgi:glycosyltransferase involved in cell wall biosynthesis
MSHARSQRRLAVVVQRYGDEINGGAETHARLLVHTLSPHAQIDVLTSRAIDNRDWKPVLPAGIEGSGGTRVIRFDHPTADHGHARHTPLRHKLRFKLRRWLARGRPVVAAPCGNPASDGEDFLQAQGPAMPGLIDWLRQHGTDYSTIFFMTARFHPSAMGVLVQPARSVLIPTLHDEKAMYLPHFHRVFRAPRHILYNAAAEQRLAHRLYGQDLAPGSICGIGVNPPEPEPESPAVAGTPDTPYLLYLGRVDRGKNCDELFRHFTRWADRSGASLRLVVAGKLSMRIPRNARIECVGFVDEPTKWALLRGATALVIPSSHESLSMVLLEALAVGTSVISNSASEVLADHVKAAQVGYTYADEESFAAALNACLKRDAAARRADRDRGKAYVERCYSWPAITSKLLGMIEEIENGSVR